MAEPTVIVEKLGRDNLSLEAQFRESFNRLSLIEDFQRAKAIFIKPNLTSPVAIDGVTTQLSFVENLAGALRKINDSTKIYIGEGEGGYHSFSMSRAMSEMGYYELENKFSNVEVVNLSKLPVKTVTLKVRGEDYPLGLPELLVNEIDFSITCPVPKVHCLTKITLGFKNQWGCIPDTMRMKNHYVFNEIISQICDRLKFRYAFLDGRYGLDNNGPMVGDTVELNWFAASNSLGAFDLTVCQMMGFDWRDVRYLTKAARLGYLPEMKNIRILGDIKSLTRKFTLRRNFWNYPAIIAFGSKNLTHLFYFSSWAKPLHDFMRILRPKTVKE